MTAPLKRPGDAIDISAEQRLVGIDVRWNAGTQTAFAERIGVALLPLTRGRLVSRDHLVFDNQPLSPEGAIILTSQPGMAEVDLTAVPEVVERICVIAYVRPRPNAPRRTLDQLDALTVSLRDNASNEVLGYSISLQTFMNAVTGATVLDLLREASGWKAVVQAQGYESGLEGAAASAGLRL